MSDQEQIAEINSEEKLKEEWAKLNQFRNELLGVHNQLKPLANLFNALKEKGIESVEDFNLALEMNKNEDNYEQEDKMIETNNETNNEDKVKKLEEIVEKQGRMIQQQETQMKVNRLMSDIKAEMGDKPEYQLLRKALNENITYNILRSQAHDEEKGLKKELSHYLGVAEKDLRGFYTKLGGTVEEGKKPEGEEKSVVSSPESLKKPIDFPSLPASGGSDAPSEDVSKTILKLGENKQTGKFDQEVAFDKFIDNKISSE